MQFPPLIKDCKFKYFKNTEEYCKKSDSESYCISVSCKLRNCSSLTIFKNWILYKNVIPKPLSYIVMCDLVDGELGLLLKK